MAKYNSKYTTGASVDAALDKANTASLVKDEDSDADLSICDGDGNVIQQFKDGHIKTKCFDSRKIAKVEKVGGKNILYLNSVNQ